MAPELDPGVAKEITQRKSEGKFVRKGDSIWVEELSWIKHINIAEEAGFDSVDDAGLFMAPTDNALHFLGTSQGFNTRKDGPEREKTVEIAQKAVGKSVKVT